MLPLPQARVRDCDLRLALDRLVRVAFAGLLPAPNRAERSDRVTLYHPAGDLRCNAIRHRNSALRIR